MIWLRNIIAYRLNSAELASADILEKLAAKPFIAIGAHDLFSQGWVPPLSSAPDLFGQEQQSAVLVTLRTDEKLLPASVIRAEADARVKKIEAEEDRKLGRREERDIRELVAAELTPRALTRARHQRAIIDLRDGFVFVEASSPSKAENLLSMLRETMGSLPTRLIDTKTSPQTAMTLWLEHGTPEGFDMDDVVVLKGNDGMKAQHVRVMPEDTEKLLGSGMLVTQMGLAWQDRISFVLTDGLQFKRLQMLDVLQEQIEEASAEDQDALFATTLALTIGELRGLVPAVITALGGENHAG